MLLGQAFEMSRNPFEFSGVRELQNGPAIYRDFGPLFGDRDRATLLLLPPPQERLLVVC